MTERRGLSSWGGYGSGRVSNEAGPCEVCFPECFVVLADFGLLPESMPLRV